MPLDIIHTCFETSTEICLLKQHETAQGTRRVEEAIDKDGDTISIIDFMILKERSCDFKIQLVMTGKRAPGGFANYLCQFY